MTTKWGIGYMELQKQKEGLKRAKELKNWLSRVGSWIVFLILLTAIICIIDGLLLN